MNCLIELIAKTAKVKLNLGFLTTKRTVKKKVTLDVVIETLLKMGIKNGDSILIHSAMSHINATAEEFIQELQKLIGPDGNILMPTHPKLEENENGELYYNPNVNQSKVGYLTEYFRKLPDVKRSLHPLSSVAIWGKDQDWFLNNNDTGYAPLPHGINSPYYRLAEKGGKVVCIGITTQSRATISHVSEEVLDDIMPLDILEEIEIFVNNAGTVKKRKFRRTILDFSMIYKCKSQLEKDWIQYGILQKEKINSTPIEVLDAHECVNLMMKKLKTGVTVYPFAPKSYYREY